MLPFIKNSAEIPENSFWEQMMLVWQFYCVAKVNSVSISIERGVQKHLNELEVFSSEQRLILVFCVINIRVIDDRWIILALGGSSPRRCQRCNLDLDVPLHQITIWKAFTNLAMFYNVEFSSICKYFFSLFLKRR